MAADRPAHRLTGVPLPVAAAVVVLLALVAASVLLGLRLRAASAEETRRQEILHAARQEAVNFTTIDHRHADRDMRRIMAGASGSFAKEFERGSDQVKKVIKENKAVSTGEFVEAGLVSADEDSARVLVVVDAEVRNTGQPKGTVRHYRMKMHLEQKQGRWLTSRLEFVG